MICHHARVPAFMFFIFQHLKKRTFMSCLSCSLIPYVMDADKHGKEFVQKAVDVSRPKKSVM